MNPLPSTTRPEEFYVNTTAPTADHTRAPIELYARTGSDDRPELVLYNPDESGEWLTVARSTAVELEDYR